MNFGITHIESVTGEICSLDKCQDDTNGFKSYSHFDNNVAAIDLSEKAANNVLSKSNISPDEIDLIIYSNGFLPDYLCWNPAAALQSRIGANQAETLYFPHGCVSALRIFDFIAGKFLSDPTFETVLFVCSNKVDGEVINRFTSMKAVISDGASAAIIKKKEVFYKWLTTTSKTEGMYSELLNYTHFSKQYDPVSKIPDLLGDEKNFNRFIQKIFSNYTGLLDKALENAELTKKSISKVVFFHDNFRNYTRLSRELSLDLEKFNFKDAEIYGHMGPADHLFGLDRIIDSKICKKGDHVLLLGMAPGFEWACSIFEVTGDYS